MIKMNAIINSSPRIWFIEFDLKKYKTFVIVTPHQKHIFYNYIVLSILPRLQCLKFNIVSPLLH